MKNMKNMKINIKRDKNIKIYNILFPIWLFYLWPTPLWLLIIPLNAVIDGLVLNFALRFYKIKLNIWDKSLLKVCVIGFLSDFTGAGLIFVIYYALGNLTDWDTFHFPGTTLVSLPGVILAGLLIYIFNQKFSFSKTNLDSAYIQKIALILAIFTAPYLMLIPLYG